MRDGAGGSGAAEMEDKGWSVGASNLSSLSHRLDWLKVVWTVLDGRGREGCSG